MWTRYIWLMTTALLLVLTNAQTTPTANEQKGKTVDYKLISERKCLEYSKWKSNLTSPTGQDKKMEMCRAPLVASPYGYVEAEFSELPHMAQIGVLIGGYYRIFSYTASLISENFLLAPANQLIEEKRPLLARFGRIENNTLKTYEIAQKYLHPNYSKETNEYDIALFRLRTPVEFTDTIFPACLQTKKEILDEEAVSSTWVQTSEYLTTNGRIKKMIVELLKPGRCEELYKLPNFDAPVWVTTGFNQSTMICSNAIDRHHFNCNPSTGEQLQIRNRTDCMYRIVGIDTGMRDECGHTPQAFTKVSEYIQWIGSIVWAEYNETEDTSKEASVCRANRKQGVCKPFKDCPLAQHDWNETSIYPKVCDYNISLICCFDPNAPEIDLPLPTTTENVEGVPTSNYGLISRRKCEEYSKWQSNSSSLENLNSSRICPFKTSYKIDKKAGPLEFPHTAQLKLHKDVAILQLFDMYIGSLISENFLLTGATPISMGYTFVNARFGTGDENSTKTYEIAEVIPHPKYEKDPLKYNIALIRLKEKVKFTEMIHPACLDTEKGIFVKKAVSTGWDSSSNQLLKSPIKLIKPSICKKVYSQVYVNNSSGPQMICGGAKGSNGEYVCRYTSALSAEHLQIGNRTDCMYRIIGVHSLGDCNKHPSLYIKISEHIPWIESIVWPQG